MLPHCSRHHLDLCPQKTTFSPPNFSSQTLQNVREKENVTPLDWTIIEAVICFLQWHIFWMSFSPKGNQSWDHFFLIHRPQSWQPTCILTCEWSAFESAPVFLIDGLDYTFSVSTLVGLDFEESSQTLLLAKGECNWVRSHLIVWTHYPSLETTLHCTLIRMTFTEAIKLWERKRKKQLSYI